MKSFSNALVLGLGISGVSAARLLIARGGAVVAIDKGNDDVLKARAGELRSLGVTVHLGVEAPSPDIRADLCVVSPGIAADSPWVVSVAARGAEVISELELGARHCACPMVAVTGSKGKSTAVKLLTELLQKGGRKAETAGNYGIPLCDVAMRSKSLDWAVVEVSSFQLECVREFHPRIGVILNIQPDHLDRHRTLENYRATKARIFARMEAADLGIVYDVDADAVKRASAGGNRWMTFGRSALADVRYESGRVVGAGAATNVSGSLFDNPILGRTAAAVAAIAYAMGIDRATIERAIREYEPLPHRMRDVITIDGVRYVNDSKATSLTAMCAGLEMSGGPVRLIAGGCLKEHDLEFTKQPLAKHVRAAYLIGQASPELEAAWKYVVPCRICGDLATAVAAAHQDATPGEVVLLSPACTSFDQFMNFEDRGEQFVKIVESIKKDERKQIVMKTRLIVGVVLVVHCVAVSSLVVVQGCRTRGAESAQGTLPLPVPEQQVVDPSVGTPLPVVPSDIEAKTTPYIVQPGDSLSVIAHRFKLSVNEIMLLNPKIKKAHDIRSGQKLVLPGEIDVKDLPPAKKQVKKEANSGKTAKTIARNEASAKVSEPAPMMSGNGNAYEVKSGDCLSKIAARNKTTTAAIKKANNLKSDVLKAGQKIVIPAAVEASVVAEPMRPVSSNTTPTATQSVTDTVVPVPAVPVEKKLSAEPVTTTTDDGDADLVPSAPDAAAGSALFKPHTVVQGEDLTVIAKSWGVSEEAIKKANGMANSTVTPGQELKIPALVNP